MNRLLFLLALCSYMSNVQAQSIYRTPSGKKYHLDGCRTVKNVSQKINATQADKAGLEPCKVCNPPDLRQLKAPGKSDKSRGESSTVQCKGKTKKGARCLHQTKIANGFCFQHQPGYF